jgi:hypothetical protein
MTAQHCYVVNGKDNVPPPGSPAPPCCNVSKLADEVAFAACQHIDHLDLVADSGSKVPVAAALVSCSHHVEAHGACQVVWEALRRRLLGSREHRRCRHHFRCQQARAR